MLDVPSMEGLGRILALRLQGKAHAQCVIDALHCPGDYPTDNSTLLIDLRIAVDRCDVTDLGTGILVLKTRFGRRKEHLDGQLLELPLVREWNDDGHRAYSVAFVVLHYDRWMWASLAPASNGTEVDPDDVSARDLD